MKNENFAERLFVDLKNNGIKIETPKYWQEGCRIGAVANSKQFVLFGKGDKFDVSGDSPLCPGYTLELSFTDAYNKLLTKILNFGNTIRFHSLVIPKKAVIEVRLEEFETVVSRYIVDYLPMCDEMLERWDIMIEKVN